MAPSRIQLASWEDGDDEACLTLLLREVLIVPSERIFRASDVDLCVVGLHAVARRLERGTSREDFDVGMDLHRIGRAYPEICAGVASEFNVPGDGGEWVGKVMMLPSGPPFLLVRTFVPGQPGGRFGFAELVSRVTRDGQPVRWSG